MTYPAPVMASIQPGSGTGEGNEVPEGNDGKKTLLEGMAKDPPQQDIGDKADLSSATSTALPQVFTTPGGQGEDF
jgi:hypothetical protein